MRLVFVLVTSLVLVGCGRIGFDLQPGQDGGGAFGDGGGGDGDAASDGSMDAGDGDAGSDAGGDGDDATDAGMDAEVDAGRGCEKPRIDYCERIPALDAVPRLDGRFDCELPLWPVSPQAWTGVDPLPSTHAVQFAVAWVADGLYVYVEVTDADLNQAQPTSPPWSGDGIELYVDDDGRFVADAYDDPGSAQLVAAAPNRVQLQIRRGMRYRAGVEAGLWVPDNFVVVPTEQGYALEAFVSARDLDLERWSLAAGQRVGFNLAANVSRVPSVDEDAGVAGMGERLGQYFLHVAGTGCGLPTCDVGAFCMPELVDGLD